MPPRRFRWQDEGASTFEVSRFKVGDVVRFPYGRRIGTITHVGAQVYDGRFLGFLYRITSYTLTERQLHRVSPLRGRRAEGANVTEEVPF